MSLFAYFGIGVLLLAGINFVFSVLILKGLSDSGIRVGYFDMRLQVHRHLKAYKKATREKLGRVGIPYYGYVGSFWLMIGSIVLLVLINDR